MEWSTDSRAKAALTRLHPADMVAVAALLKPSRQLIPAVEIRLFAPRCLAGQLHRGLC